ncbi:hypothetical protein INT47_000001 [Mucor saturninus]|uniref:C2H2-type domain-containing protein n=1 Tax=Mucor saturninus TaxID=64648 RepID=A0A8H7V9T8_9FUNG|nr:hypothetical protein INT47_000001 [Mucor saturninus]
MDKHWIRYHHMDYSINHKRYLPCLEGPDFYCETCQIHYESKIRFVSHLKHDHRIQGPSFPDYSDEPPNVMDPDNHCKPCCLCFDTRPLYRSHLFIKHNITVYSHIVSVHDNTKPDVFNEKNHCDACNKTFVSRHAFLQHLHYSYGIDVEPYKRPRTQNDLDQFNKRQQQIDVPNLHDPSLYCATCCRTYDTRLQYQHHLRMIHNIYSRPVKGFTMRTRKAPLDIVPDLDNPDNHCTSCQCTYKSKESFVSHLRYSHQLPSKQQ